MVGELITFPLRAGVFGVRLVFRATEEVSERVTAGALSVFSVLSRDNAGRGTSETASPPRERAARARDPRSQATGPVARETPPSRTPRPVDPPVAPPAPTPAPAHVSEEPELVREEAERGAEDGAGAEVTVREPWEGYARMSAKDVVARLTAAAPAELAAVALYEAGSRGRQTILDAVQRQLKAANGGD